MLLFMAKIFCSAYRNKARANGFGALLVNPGQYCQLLWDAGVCGNDRCDVTSAVNVTKQLGCVPFPQVAKQSYYQLLSCQWYYY